MIAKDMYITFFDKCRESMSVADGKLEDLMLEGVDVVARRRLLGTKVKALQVAERTVRDLNLGVVQAK